MPAPKGKPVRRLNDRFPDYAHPEGMENLATAGDLAAELGVRHPHVSNWIARYEDFPQPRLIAGRGRGSGLWDLDEVKSWHATTFHTAQPEVSPNPRSRSEAFRR